MASFEVNGRFSDDPRTLALPKRAVAVYLLAGLWCAGRGTDTIPAGELPAVNGTAGDAAELVEAGLLVETPAGYRFTESFARFEGVPRGA